MDNKEQTFSSLSTIDYQLFIIKTIAANYWFSLVCGEYINQ